MLIKMGIEYGSADSIVLCDRIGFIMADVAIGTSAYLARDFGPYNKFKPETLNKNLYFIENTREETKRAVKRFGLRNSQLLTIAPTGSISTMLGVSGGIEPIFDTSYTRKTESLHGHDQYYEVYTPIVKAYLDNNEVIHNLTTGKPVLPAYFVTAKTIDPMKRVKMQSIWQKHIDASISSTVNLPESATVEDVRRLYIYAWKNRLKGLTIFRENCARVGVLTSEKKEEPKEEPEVKIEEKDILPEEKVFDKIKPMTRSDLGGRLNGGTYVKKTACGKLYITINRDDNDNLVEVFIDPGKSGGCVANAESLGRMASTMLRGGMAIESIVDSVKGVKCSACTQAKGSKKVIDGLSCGDILARTIQEEYDRFNKCETCSKKEIKDAVKEKDILKEQFKAMKNPKNWVIPNNTCPECGMEMANEGGCVTCKNCGYSKCD